MAVTPAPVWVPIQQPLVLSFISVVAKVENFLLCLQLWISADEMMDAIGYFIMNLIMHKLDSDAAPKAYLIYVKLCRNKFILINFSPLSNII